MTQDEVLAFYGRMTRRELETMRRVFVADQQGSEATETKAFCAGRLQLIDRLLEESRPESGRPCGCDPAANWTCEAHRTAEQS